jgi:hypothetical protein
VSVSCISQITNLKPFRFISSNIDNRRSRQKNNYAPRLSQAPRLAFSISRETLQNGRPRLFPFREKLLSFSRTGKSFENTKTIRLVLHSPASSGPSLRDDAVQLQVQEQQRVRVHGGVRVVDHLRTCKPRRSSPRQTLTRFCSSSAESSSLGCTPTSSKASSRRAPASGTTTLAVKRSRSSCAPRRRRPSG